MITIIKNAKVFNGVELLEHTTIAIEDGKIVNKAEGDMVIDGNDCTLLPGLIDSHVHLYGVENLRETAKYGITTVLDMGVRNHVVIDDLRNCKGVSGILSSCLPAYAPNSGLAKKMKFPNSVIVQNAADSVRFVHEQINFNADYIKVIIEDEGKNGGVAFPADILEGIVNEAHKNGKRVVSHVVSPQTFELAINSGVDVLTHIPFIVALPQAVVDSMVKSACISVPTMVAMKAIVDNIEGLKSKFPFRLMKKFSKKLQAMPTFKYNYVEESVEKIRQAGIPILAGSDSNMGDKTTPFSVEYGSSLHEELKLLVKSGCTPIQALQSATSIPADYWKLSNRGRIALGYPADLLLVKGNPIENIEDTKNIKNVWIAGDLIH
ncbi:amidohydrolase [Clostridia bacterium]|nr:amidohydrolase [Clostridia bacterium]